MLSSSLKGIQGKGGLQVNEPIDDAKKKEGEDIDCRKHQDQRAKPGVHGRDEEICSILISSVLCKYPLLYKGTAQKVATSLQGSL